MLNQSIKQYNSWLLVAVLALVVGGCSTVPSVPGLGSISKKAGTNDVATSRTGSSKAIAQPNVKPANREAFAQALAAIEAERWHQAEPLLRKVTANQPKLAGPWVNLAQVYVATEQLEEARLALSQALNANPDHCAARNQLGVLSRQAGDFSAAEGHYKRCLNSEPDNETVVLNLGILYELYLGRLPEALAAYRQYQDLSDTEDRKVKGWVMDLERRLGV